LSSRIGDKLPIPGDRPGEPLVEVDLRVPSIEKAASLLGFKPTVSLESGISRTIPWYREHLIALTSDRKAQATA